MVCCICIGKQLSLPAAVMLASPLSSYFATVMLPCHSCCCCQCLPLMLLLLVFATHAVLSMLWCFATHASLMLFCCCRPLSYCFAIVMLLCRYHAALPLVPLWQCFATCVGCQRTAFFSIPPLGIYMFFFNSMGYLPSVK